MNNNGRNKKSPPLVGRARSHSSDQPSEYQTGWPHAIGGQLALSRQRLLDLFALADEWLALRHRLRMVKLRAELIDFDCDLDDLSAEIAELGLLIRRLSWSPSAAAVESAA